MKNNNAQPRKNNNQSSKTTQMRSLNNRISHLQSEVTPITRVTGGSPTPNARRQNKAIWIPRTVRVYKQITASTVVTLGDIIKGLTDSTTEILSFRVDSIRAWNVTNTSTTTNYVNVLLSDTLFANSEPGNANTGPFEDWGAGSTPAHLSINVPFTLTSDRQGTISSTGTAFTVSPVPTGITTTPNTLVFDVGVKVSYGGN